MTNYDDLSATESVLSDEVRADAEATLAEQPPADTDEALTNLHVGEWIDAESLASRNLKKIRTVLGVSQQQISDRLSEASDSVRLAQTQIAKIERGERPWRLNELFAIAGALNVDWTEFFKGTGIEEDPNLILLAARLKYDAFQRAESNARDAWRQAARERVAAAIEMCRTAAKLGVKDPEVFEYLRSRYFDKEYHEQRITLDASNMRREDVAERYEVATAYAESEWQKLYDAYHSDSPSASSEGSS